MVQEVQLKIKIIKNLIFFNPTISLFSPILQHIKPRLPISLTEAL